MNAAISASVVLASRLQTNLAVFALMLLSIQLFALFPILRKRMQVRRIQRTRIIVPFVTVRSQTPRSSTSASRSVLR